LGSQYKSNLMQARAMEIAEDALAELNKPDSQALGEIVDAFLPNLNQIERSTEIARVNIALKEKIQDIYYLAGYLSKNRYCNHIIHLSDFEQSEHVKSYSIALSMKGISSTEYIDFERTTQPIILWDKYSFNSGD